MRIVKKQQAQADYNTQVTLEHLNASLNSFAYHEPKHIPSVDKLLHKTQEEVVTSHDEVKKLLRAAGLPCPD